MKSKDEGILSEIRKSWSPEEVTPEASPNRTFHEFGIREQDGETWKVTHPFLLNTKLGPLASIPEGSLVHLAYKTGREAFLDGRVEPILLGEVFEVVRAFQTVKDGEWVDLAPGDVIKLTREEALHLLRQGKIKEKKGE
jgi:hypothetical protein